MKKIEMGKKYRTRALADLLEGLFATALDRQNILRMAIASIGTNSLQLSLRAFDD